MWGQVFGIEAIEGTVKGQGFTKDNSITIQRLMNKGARMILDEKRSTSTEKLMEEMRFPISHSLIKAAAWTHNTSVNKLGFYPLQLVTGKADTIPGLTTRNIVTESMTDAEAVQRTMEKLTSVISEFRQTDMRLKVQDCQKY